MQSKKNVRTFRQYPKNAKIGNGMFVNVLETNTLERILSDLTDEKVGKSAEDAKIHIFESPTSSTGINIYVQFAGKYYSGCEFGALLEMHEHPFYEILDYSYENLKIVEAESI